jgi:cytochrome c5
MELLRSGSAAEAAKVLEQSGNLGDARAQYYVGLLYFHGRGVEKDVRKAEYWWRKSANNGNPDGWYALYVLYVNSNIAPEDLPKVLDYLATAARKGNKGAQQSLEFLKIFLSAQQPLAKLDNESLWTGNAETPDDVELRLGKKIYANGCSACHATGVAGSPKAMNRQDWEERMKQGFDVLVTHAIQGYTGKSGVMPAKGGNIGLKDAEVAAAVRYMTTY